MPYGMSAGRSPWYSRPIAERLEEPRCLRHRLPPRGRLAPRRQDAVTRPVECVAMSAPVGVVEHGELAEEGVLLEGAAEAEAGEGPRRQLGHALAVEVDVAVVAHAVGDGGEAAALAGAIRPDDAEDLPGVDRPGEVAERDERAVADAEPLDAGAPAPAGHAASRAT